MYRLIKTLDNVSYSDTIWCMDSQRTAGRRLTLDELTALAGYENRRTVRYYIQQGLVDRPIGETRAAYYTDRHLEQLLAVRRWTEAGLSLERIRELIHGEQDDAPPPRRREPGSVEVWNHTLVADGIELMVEAKRAGLSPAQLRSLFQRVREAYEDIVREGKK